MKYPIWLAAILVSVVSGCVSHEVPLVYGHSGGDTPAAPFQAAFDAPHGGYLFPFQDKVIEVQFGRNGAAQTFLYNAEGKAIDLDESFRRASLIVSPMGGTHGFAIKLLHDEREPNRFWGQVSFEDILHVEHSPALRFSFSLPDIRHNVTRTQCHSAHWSTATQAIEPLAIVSIPE